jgi:AcrR family transcriptional regulator
MLVTINRVVYQRAGGTNGPFACVDAATTRRSRAKSDRRTQLIAAAERLVAERGYLAVRLEDIGAAAGVSGPAIYRHFPNKEALLVELLVGISTRLLAGATAVVERATDPADALDGLIDFHLDFALGESDLIRIQDRDLGHLHRPPNGRCVRRSGSTSRSGRCAEAVGRQAR